MFWVTSPLPWLCEVAVGKSSQLLAQAGAPVQDVAGQGSRGALITTTTLQPREPGAGVMEAIYSQGLWASQAGSIEGLTPLCEVWSAWSAGPGGR